MAVKKNMFKTYNNNKKLSSNIFEIFFQIFILKNKYAKFKKK